MTGKPVFDLERMKLLWGAKMTPEPPGWPYELTMLPGLENVIVDVLQADAIEIMGGGGGAVEITAFRGELMVRYRERFISGARRLQATQIEQIEEYAAQAIRLRMVTPGFEESVDMPCEHNDLGKRILWDAVMHLNDIHHPERIGARRPWGREDIAEWMESLDIDLTVDTEADPKEIMRQKIRDLVSVDPFLGRRCQCEACRTRRQLLGE